LLTISVAISIILEKAVESTTSGYCTDNLRVFDDFLLHRMGDTPSAKNHQKLSNYQHIRHSRYDSTAFSRIILAKMEQYSQMSTDSI
jgi:hypothetical protein